MQGRTQQNELNRKLKAAMTTRALRLNSFFKLSWRGRERETKESNNYIFSPHGGRVLTRSNISLANDGFTHQLPSWLL